jgi:hypothetical protein
MDNQSYSIGYGKPPKAHCFRPGQSGNPRGRKPNPLRSAPVEAILRAVLSETTTVRLDGKKRTMTNLEAFELAEQRLLLKGGPDGARALERLAKNLGRRKSS